MKFAQFKTSKQPGYSIVSLLLTLLLMSMLCAGFIRLYQNRLQPISEANFQALTYSPFFSSLIFNSHTQALGFYPFDSVSYKPYETIVPLFAPQSRLISVNSISNSGDSFVLQYQGNDSGNVFNCQGTPLMANQQTESYYYISPQHDLVCTSNGQESAIAYPIMKNVESMVIRLGEDLDNDGLVNQYITPKTPNLTFDKVVNIRVSLLLRTDEIAEDLPASQYYNLDGEEKGPFKDFYIRKVLTTTVPLKNKSDL